ncbi:MAG: hypothetical protein UX17_C0039G0005 [Parcubacteria group bacterium GW2011_GWC2_45_7]|nr:MAG: hypothetical protein UX17_C0039G0005 [Parcubacteria group bacterium GW2011_GWC2_45_7]
MVETRYVWVRLGGLSLRLWVYLFHGTKLMFLQGYYTIAAGKKFCGHVLKNPYRLDPGWIIGWHWRGDGPNRRQIYYHVKSAYDTERSFRHASASEEVARDRVGLSIETAGMLVRDLLAYWPLTKSQRARLTRKLRDLRERYRRAQRPALQGATDQVTASAGFRDSRGRSNPRASAARLLAAQRRYGVRLEEITSIVPHLGRLHVLVTQELARIQHTLLEHDFELLQEVRRKLPRCKEERDLRWATATLQDVRRDLATIRVAPFYRNCRYMEAEIAMAVQAIIATMINSIVFKRAQRVLEGLIREVSMAQASGELDSVQPEAYARRVQGFAQRAERLCEGGFRHKRLVALQKHLAKAVKNLRAGELVKAKDCLKAASRLL